MTGDSTSPTRVSVCMFGGASSLPILAASQRGLFEASGLDVDITLTRSSSDLMQGLLDGDFDIVHAAPGNFIAWRDRTQAPIVAWLGGTSGPIRLVAQPFVSDLTDLAGRDVAVDAVTSGFVSILRYILRAGGIDDVDLVPLGATSLRFEALKAGETTATMLTLPWSAVAARDGFQVLADQNDVLPRLQGSCAASLRPWLEDHAHLADAYTRAIVAAITWLNDPVNASEGTALVAANYEIDPDIADDVRRSIMDPRAGWVPSGMIDAEGMELVCRMRTENGQAPQGPPESYYTLSVYRRVLGFGLLA